MQKQMTTIGGVLAAMLLVATPVLAAQDQRAESEKQPSPSTKTVPEAKTEAVNPGAVGKAPSAGPQSTGTAQASPSQAPAPKATPGAVEAEQSQGKSETR
jgi:hypothetical protein